MQIDAAWHYSPTTNGKKAKTIDEIPLEWCFGEGIVIDMKHKPDFDPITVEDIDHFLQANDLTIKPGMIVLIKTGRDQFNGTKDFHKIGTGMSASATEWLIDQGIKVMGIDSWGWDLPLPYHRLEQKKHESSRIFLQAFSLPLNFHPGRCPGLKSSSPSG